MPHICVKELHELPKIPKLPECINHDMKRRSSHFYHSVEKEGNRWRNKFLWTSLLISLQEILANKRCHDYQIVGCSSQCVVAILYSFLQMRNIIVENPKRVKARVQLSLKIRAWYVAWIIAKITVTTAWLKM